MAYYMHKDRVYHYFDELKQFRSPGYTTGGGE